MKGIILAGGLGTRLGELTKVTNKHLLPVYSKPMIYHPLETLIDAGIKEIRVVSGPEHTGDFLELLGSGERFNAGITYSIQEKPLGIAHAISLAEDFANGEAIAAILGDNIFEDRFNFDDFYDGAKVFLKEVPDANRFGVAEISNGRLAGIEEKPKNPKTNYAVTGLYLYDHTVFYRIKNLKPSARGELEVSELNSSYIKDEKMQYEILKGFWTDAGTFDSLLRANILASQKEKQKK
ncbi:NTP transferase domain-containing protein [Candidatus Pacearchaeota archaeon]|nr:NTP transferase domain-containing protein [Candidatus Pacearchaeota archaeon]